jgi:predicted metal-dependent peptidase
MKSLILYLIALGLCIVLAGCGPKPYQKTIIGLDVSSSAQDNLIKSRPLMQERLLGISSKEMLIFVFGDNSYETYSGTKPTKDRDVMNMYDNALKQSKDVKWNRGTNFDTMLEFLSRKVINDTLVIIYTDGYFEQSGLDNNKIAKSTLSLNKSGLKEIEFIGVKIENKEKIYSWFKDSGINIVFTSLT